MIPLASSARSDVADCTANTVTIIAIIITSSDSSGRHAGAADQRRQRLPGVVDEVLHGLHDRAEEQGAEREGDGPADDRTALQPQRQAQRTAEPSGSRGVPGALGQQAGAEVPAPPRSAQPAPAGRPVSRSIRPSGHHRFGAPRLHLLAPADGREPGQSAVAEVADHAQHVEHAEHRGAQGVGGTGGRGDLPGQRADPEGDQPDPGDGGAGDQRTGDPGAGRVQPSGGRDDRDPDADGSAQRCQDHATSQPTARAAPASGSAEARCGRPPRRLDRCGSPGTRRRRRA